MDLQVPLSDAIVVKKNSAIDGRSHSERMRVARGLPATEVIMTGRSERNTAASTERRNPASRVDLLRRISVEYAEMPGLCLTIHQAERLFCLRHDICARALDELVANRYLRRHVSGAYIRNLTRP